MKQVSFSVPMKATLLFDGEHGPQIDIPPGVTFDLEDLDTNERGATAYFLVPVMVDVTYHGEETVIT